MIFAACYFVTENPISIRTEPEERQRQTEGEKDKDERHRETCGHVFGVELESCMKL